MDVTIEFLSCFIELTQDGLLMMHVREDDRRIVWAQGPASRALRLLEAKAGIHPSDYALHSLRVGGAAHLSDAAASPEVVQKEGRWRDGGQKRTGHKMLNKRENPNQV